MLLVFALAGLALFSILSIVLGAEDGRESPQPSPRIATWVFYGRR